MSIFQFTLVTYGQGRTLALNPRGCGFVLLDESVLSENTVRGLRNKKVSESPHG